MAKKRSVGGKTGVKARTARSGPAVRIDYPREGERLSHPSYTLRVAALPEARDVEVSIDGGQWRPCREALGLWWYDWSDYGPGEHTLQARSRIADGVSATSEPRRFTVS